METKEPKLGLPILDEDKPKSIVSYEDNSGRIYIDGCIDEGFGIDLQKALDKIEYSSKHTPKEIHIDLNTDGGYCREVLAVVNRIIEMNSNENRPDVHIHVSSYAYSAGFILWLVGKQRTMGEYSDVMWHDVGFGAFGKTKEVEERVEEVKKLRVRLGRIIRRFTDFTEKELNEIYESKKDHYFEKDDIIGRLKNGYVKVVLEPR